MLPRQADALGNVLADPAMGTSGGWSTAIGYGPYTIAPSESLHIVIAEVASGLTRDAAVQIGKAYKAANTCIKCADQLQRSFKNKKRLGFYRKRFALSNCSQSNCELCEWF